MDMCHKLSFVTSFHTLKWEQNIFLSHKISPFLFVEIWDLLVMDAMGRNTSGAVEAREDLQRWTTAFSVRSCPAPALNEAEILWKNLPSHPATIGCTQGWAGLGLYKCKLIFPWGWVLHSVVRLCVEAFSCRNICGWWSEVSFNGSIIFSQKLTYLTQNTYTEMHTHTYFSCKAMWCFILNPLNLGFCSAFPSPPQRAHLCCWGGLCKRITHRGGFCYHRGRSRQGICNYEDRKYKPLRQECSGDQLHSCSPGKSLQ